MTTTKINPIKAITAALYASRKARTTHPEGTTDNGGRWYPSARECAGDVRERVRAPSARWPWSYMLRARTREHCALLVARALAGGTVPPDVEVLLSTNLYALCVLAEAQTLARGGAL